MAINDNIQAGLLTEIACQYEFTRYGIVLFAPITTDSRSDFIADIDNKLIRIQCKSALSCGDGSGFTFNTYSSNWNTRTKRTYEGQIDYFYTIHDNISYLVPISIVGSKKTQKLRIKDGDIKNSRIVWAKDFLFEKIIQELNPSLKPFQPHVSKAKESFCIDCGAPISYGAKRCRNCNDEQKRLETSQLRILELEEKISRGELKKMIRTLPFTTIGKNFGVSDNTIRKWCKKFNLPDKKTEINLISDEEWNNI